MCRWSVTLWKNDQQWGLSDAVAELQQIVCHCGVAGWHNLDSAGIHSGDSQRDDRR